MWYLDEPLVETFTKIIKKKPDFYFFGLESWRFVYTHAATVMSGIPRMFAVSGDKLYRMETSVWTTAKWFPDKVETLSFSQIRRAKRSRFIFAHFWQIELSDGKLLRLVVNPWLYLRLHGQKEGIRRFEEKLKTKPWTN